MKCHDLCKGLAMICNPTEELDFLFDGECSDWQCYNCKSWNVSEDRYSDEGKWWMCRDCEFNEEGEPDWKSKIDLIIAEGNEHPIHPDHVRSLRDQCKDANVPFHFAGWGDYQHGASPRPMHECHIFQPDGPWMEKVGKERSGRLLDGQEHNGRIS